MSRRRYISTKISLDSAVNKFAQQYGDFAVLLYTWMIPHVEDDATLSGDPEELLGLVAPLRRDKTVNDVIAALEGMEYHGLIRWDRQANVVYFPESFYVYQSYIKPDKRRAQISEEQRKTPEIVDEQRESAQNAASFSSSFSPSLLFSSSSSPPTPKTTDDLAEQTPVVQAISRLLEGNVRGGLPSNRDYEEVKRWVREGHTDVVATDKAIREALVAKRAEENNPEWLPDRVSFYANWVRKAIRAAPPKARAAPPQPLNLPPPPSGIDYDKF